MSLLFLIIIIVIDIVISSRLISLLFSYVTHLLQSVH